MSRAGLSAACVVLVATTTWLGADQAPAPPAPVPVLLDRYLSGQFDDALGAADEFSDLDVLLDGLKRDGAAWVDRATGGERQRRALAAATFALEIARAHEWDAWKEVAIIPIPCEGCNPSVTIYRDTHWRAPPLLVEWGCELLRRDSLGEIERLWQLAALAVAERAQDYEFLNGDRTQKIRPTSVPSTTQPILHVVHARQRFPDEPRLKLAEGIADEWHEPVLARRVFEQLKDDLDVGGEATMRLGAADYRSRDDNSALALFRRVPSLTRDPWVIHLTRYFSGLIQERRQQPLEAERAYRAALAAVPHAESASIALGSLLFRTGRRTEGSVIIDAMLAASPRPRDPWRTYADADDRFWADYIRMLHTVIRR